MSDEWSEEIEQGRRFRFGANWQKYARAVDEGRIRQAEESLTRMLGPPDLQGCTFLDAGCGSGLFSLAARNLGAKVFSFDFDPDSVATTEALKERYRPGDEDWSITRASVLDRNFLDGLPRFDVVYSWGVLHHTGAMWDGLAGLLPRVAPSGRLYIALYNRQAIWSKVHTRMKRAYVGSGPLGRTAMLAAFSVWEVSRAFAVDVARLKNPAARYLSAYTRGMSIWHDWVDWVGGYPFEVSTPDEVFNAVAPQGFTLTALRTCGGGSGCNEFVFRRRQ